MSWRDRKLPEVAHILRQLIDAPSPNPPGNCEAVAAVCVQLLAATLPTVEVIRSDDGTPSVTCTIGSGSRTLLIHSHYDTQPVGDRELWHSDPYVADLRDGFIYGRGAGDDKGSVAAQLAAALSLARDSFDPGFTLRFAFVADEESGGARGTRFLKERGALSADAVVIGEQTHNQLAIGERGIVWMKVTFRGRPAHGAIPSAGVSALAPAARFADVLDRELGPLLADRRPTSLLPASSLNIGKLHAGVDVSTVPDLATIEIDRRIVPGETADGCEAEIRRILEDVMRHHEGVTTTVHRELGSSAFLTPADHPFVRMAVNAGGNDGSMELTGYDQASDARFSADDGIPIVIFGPSDPRVGHAANECVSVAQLVEAQAYLVDLCHAFANHDEPGTLFVPPAI